MRTIQTNVSEITPELNNEITKKALKNNIKSQSDFNHFFKLEVEKYGFKFSEYREYCIENFQNDFYKQ